MSTTGPHVHIVEEDPTLAALEAMILREEGYAVTWEVYAPDTLAHLQRERPDLIVMDIPPPDQRQQAALATIDALRMAPETAGIPVVVVSTSEATSELARASYNVRAVLEKPFELADLLGKVRVALDFPPLQAAVAPEVEAQGIFQAAERALAGNARGLMLAWVQQLRQQEPWRSRYDLELADVFDSVPVLLEAVVAALRYDSGEEFLAAHPRALDRVRGHAAERRVQGIALTAVVHEYTQLRQEILRMLERALPGTGELGEAFKVAHAVNHTLDLVTEATIAAYLATPPDAVP